jgi:hypothetical protein
VRFALDGERFPVIPSGLPQRWSPPADGLAAPIGVRAADRLRGVNDAERLCRDPAMCWIVGDRAITGSAASASEMGRFETKWLSRPENLAALVDLPSQWIDEGSNGDRRR